MSISDIRRYETIEHSGVEYWELGSGHCTLFAKGDFAPGDLVAIAEVPRYDVTGAVRSHDHQLLPFSDAADAFGARRCRQYIVDARYGDTVFMSRCEQGIRCRS